MLLCGVGVAAFCVLSYVFVLGVLVFVSLSYVLRCVWGCVFFVSVVCVWFACVVGFCLFDQMRQQDRLILCRI